MATIMNENERFHLKIKNGDVGRYVILPGDPGRVPKIAALLDDARQIAQNREYNIYTGTLLGEKVSVCSTGIGGPSAAIAVEELIDSGADTFIRVGTSGGIDLSVFGGDLVIAEAAIRAEGTSYEYIPQGYPSIADFDVTTALAQAAKELSSGEPGNRYHVGVVHSKDSFYGEVNPDGSAVGENIKQRWDSYFKCGCLTSEMECAAIYAVGLVRSVFPKKIRCGGVLTALWNAERSKRNMPDNITHDSTRGIECAIRAVELLIERDKEFPISDREWLIEKKYGGTLTVSIYDTTLRILQYEGEERNVEIPGEIFGKRVTEIGEYAFCSNKTLTSVTIPEGVTSIGVAAFKNCSSLTSVTIPDSVTSICGGAFNYCDSLTSVTIPNSVTSIESNAFENCSSLEKIVVDSQNENYSSVDGVLFNKDRTELIYYPARKKGTSYEIPDSVTSIEWYAFFNNPSLKSVTIPDSVTSIDCGAFSYCKLLTDVTIPNSVTSIKEFAFDGSILLTNVTFNGTMAEWGEIQISFCNDALTEAKIICTDGTISGKPDEPDDSKPEESNPE